APEEVIVASTGVIGVPLPMDKVRAGIAQAAAAVSRSGGALAAEGLLTTDTKPKEPHIEVELGTGRGPLRAPAKGAGMIAPNLATLLAFFTTDAAVEAGPLRAALAEAVGESLNRITVDGDTSTNDCAIILASGAGGTATLAEDGEDYQAFRRALT